MAAETLQKIMSVALDMKNVTIKMGIPERKLQQEQPPPVLFDIPSPKPLREALLKLKLRKETINILNQIYITRANEYRSETAQELQLLWRSLHVEGSLIPLQAWEKALLLTQRKIQETLDDLFDMVISRARDHVADKKRKSQPVFNQRVTDFLLWCFANSQNPSRDEKKKLAVSTGLTYKQVDIWFQNRRARTKKKMAKTGITDLQEALGNPKRPDFASLPDPIRETLSKKKRTRKEMKILNKRIECLKRKEQERGSKPKRVKIELTRSLLREENEPPLDWVCPRGQAEKAIRDKFISGELQGIDSWSAPAYAYPTEWSKETREAWRQVDMLYVSKFEHKSTPHPDSPKDVTVTDEEMETLTKQFAGLKIEVLKKIYWHQYPDGRPEAIHPKLVRVRKDGTFFMYDDAELKDSPKLTPTSLPRSTRLRHGDSASHPIIVDRPGTSATDPIAIKDHSSSAHGLIVSDIPGASAAIPILASVSVSGPIVGDVPGAFTSDPIVVGKSGARAASSTLPQAINPIVIVDIPEATEGDMKMASHVNGRGAAESKGNGRTTSFATTAPLPSAVGDDALANELDMFIARLRLPPRSYSHENVQSSLPPGIFDVPEPGTLPAEYPPANSAPFEGMAIYPVHTDQPRTLDEELAKIIESVNTCNDPQAQVLPANSVPFEVPAIDPVPTDQARTLDEGLAEFFESMNTYNLPQVQVFPVNFVPSQVPVIDPVDTNQQRIFDELGTLDELVEFFESVDTYHTPQAQILPQSDGDCNSVFTPSTAATVYQPIPEISAKGWPWWDGLGPPSCRLQHWKSLSRVPQPAS